MNISALAIRLIFLGLPGLLASGVYRKLRGRRPKARWEDLFEVLIFSLLAYVVYALIALPAVNWLASRGSLISHAFGTRGAPKSQAADTQPVFIKAIFDEKVPLSWPEIAWASVIAVGLALAASYVHKFKLINRLGRVLRASRRSGDEEIWEYFFDSSHVKWVLVRDLKRELAYHGFVRAYSESEKPRELVLERVLVCRNNDGVPLYEASVVYLSREGHELSVEIGTKPAAERSE